MQAGNILSEDLKVKVMDLNSAVDQLKKIIFAAHCDSYCPLAEFAWLQTAEHALQWCRMGEISLSSIAGKKNNPQNRYPFREGQIKLQSPAVCIFILVQVFDHFSVNVPRAEKLQKEGASCWTETSLQIPPPPTAQHTHTLKHTHT